jgi:hypothetical protein
MRMPFIIGVAGGTASGKTTVCDYIMKRLQDQGVVMLSQVRMTIHFHQHFHQTTNNIWCSSDIKERESPFLQCSSSPFFPFSFMSILFKTNARSVKDPNNSPSSMYRYVTGLVLQGPDRGPEAQRRGEDLHTCTFILTLL